MVCCAAKGVPWKGACGWGLTMIWTSSNDESCPSLAVRRRTYVPAAKKLAVVEGEDASTNVTFPGPLNLLHVLVRLGGLGWPSSLTTPLRNAPLGSVIV